MIIFQTASSHSQFHDALVTGADILNRYRAFWNFNAFKQNPSALNDLLRSIQNLNEETLWQIDACRHKQADYFATYFPLVFEWLNQYEPQHAAPAMLKTPFWLSRDIPGRKWQQISDFYCAIARQLSSKSMQKLPALEWCAGKGHLGRIYSFIEQQPVTSIEREFGLCQDGANLSKKSHLSHFFINADVNHLPLKTPFLPSQLWMALHACGDLHLQFLQGVKMNLPEHIAMAPCCYHRQQSPVYKALSAAGIQTNLFLDSDALRLAQQNQMTASQKERKQRALELNWRLGYQALCKTSNSGLAYKTLPPLKKKQFGVNDFETFCLWGAKQHCWRIAKHIEWSHFEKVGAQERINMMRKDAIRHCFRRVIELWLIFDKAMYLIENGYSVSLQQFCEPTVSPRNLLLLANRNIT